MSGQNLMASSTIVDTDIIIDVGRGIPEAVILYARAKINFQISNQHSYTNGINCWLR
jgi:hypothetical protein